MKIIEKFSIIMISGACLEDRLFGLGLSPRFREQSTLSVCHWIVYHISRATFYELLMNV